MFGKLSQKLGLSQNDREIVSQLNDLQEAYNALKQQHELQYKLLTEKKNNEKSSEDAYERLKKQFSELSLYISIKQSENFNSIKQQQEEISKKKDALDIRENLIHAKEQELLLRSKCLDMIESGKNLEDIVRENQSLAQENQILQEKIQIYQKNYEKILADCGKISMSLKEGLGKISKGQKEIKAEYAEKINEFKTWITDFGENILKETKERIVETQKIKTQEEKKIDRPEPKKQVIPLNFKKKPVSTLNKADNLDLEKELGNSFN